MKIHIWIKKEDVKKGVITEYHTNQPQISCSSYVQVSITSDEYVQLDDDIYDPIDRDPADSIECCDEENPCSCNENEMPDIVKVHQTITGGNFTDWWAKLTKKEQITITEYYDR